MAMMNKQRCLAAMVRTPVILQAVLRDVTADRARQATDGPDGWSVVQILCHLRDFDGFYQHRIQMMLDESNPHLPAYDHEAIAIEQNYQGQDIADVLAAYLASRRQFVTMITGLSDEQLERDGIHPESGSMTVLEQAFRSVTHDIDHTEQIVRALGYAARF
jgi:uncharacterized damage-inducible protein DinB